MSSDPFAEYRGAMMDLWRLYSKQLGDGNPFQTANTQGGVDTHADAVDDGDGVKPEGLNFYRQMFGKFAGLNPSGAGFKIPGGDGFLEFGQLIQRYLQQLSQGNSPAELSATFTDWFEQVMQQNQFGGAATNPWENIFPDHQFPSFGPTREWQTLSSEMREAYADQQKAQAKMQQHSLNIFRLASEGFFSGLKVSDGELSSLKSIYDYWIDCAESAYRDVVMTEDYARDFGAMINTQSVFKKRSAELNERLFEMLNLPNRRELDGVINNVHALGRRFDKLNTNEQYQSEIAGLKKQIDQLNEQLAALIARPSPSEQPPESEKAKSAQTTRTASKRSRKKTTKRQAKPATKAKSSAVKDEFAVTQILDKS